MYYFNKIAFNHYPYFYWTHATAYKKYNYEIGASKKSQHVRSVLFFFFIKLLSNFSSHKISFSKLTFKTFEGVIRSIRKLSKEHMFFLNKNVLKYDNIRHPLESQNKVFFNKDVIVYNKFLQQNISTPIYKFFINTIVHANFYKFTNVSEVKLLNRGLLLKLTWYNKVHNSIINPIKQNIIMYLRASRHFNKGRYSRNRQLYRTGVYWCIWLNVVIVYGLHFYFYRVVFAFGYLWLALGLMILVMLSSRLYKYRFYNITQLSQEFKEFSNFLFILWLNFRTQASSIYKVFKQGGSKFLINYTVLFAKFIQVKINNCLNLLKTTIL
jgi:hypothetical protein